MFGFIISGYWRARKGTDEELLASLQRMFLSDSLVDFEWSSKGMASKKRRPVDFSDDAAVLAIIHRGVNRNIDGDEIGILGRSIALWSRSNSVTIDFSAQYGSERSNILNCCVMKFDFSRNGPQPPVDLEAIFRCVISVWSPEVAVLCSKEFFYDHRIGIGEAPTDWLAYLVGSHHQSDGDWTVDFHEGTITSTTS